MRDQERQRRGRDAIEARSLPNAAGPAGLQLVAGLVGEAPQLRIVQAVRQLEAFIPAIGCDIRRLAREIDIVLGVDFELLGDVRREIAKAGPNPGEFGHTDMRMRQQLESAAPLAVLVESKPVTNPLVWRELHGLSKFSRRRQSRHLLPVAPATSCADASQGNAFVGQSLVGIVGPQCQSVFRA